MEIRFLPVGCGDGIHIRYEGNDSQYRNIFIDGGVEKGQIYPQVLRKEIEKVIDTDERIDLWIITHKRCTKERNLILNYYLNGIEDRAIYKANTKLGLSSFVFNTAFNDFPYRSWMIYRDQYFDYEKINKVAHRCYDVSISDDLEEVYYKNKQQFYNKLFKIKPVSQIFSNIDFHYDHIPHNNDRKTIFLELRKLFKARRWLAFFALALPQVEGLFTEMLSTVSPDDKGK